MKKRKKSVIKKNEKDNKENFFKRNYKESFIFLKESWIYFLVIASLLVVFALIGYFFPIFFVEQIKQMITNLVQETRGLSGPQLIGFIFLNNIKTSAIGLFSGIVFGLFPLITIVVNGYVLGFVASYAVKEGGIFVLWKLLPHGIFEIPAVVISLGVGLRLGMYLFTRDRKKKFFGFFVNCLRILFFVVLPLLIIAAIIEGSLIFLMK